MRRFLKIFLPSVFLLLAAAGLTGYILQQKGYFADPAVAKRELNALGKEPSSAELHAAAARGDLPLLRLLSRSGLAFTSLDGNGCTPLHHALANEHYHLLPLLEAEGSDLNARDSYGHTPLSILLEKGELELASSLIAKGASPDYTLPNGELALPGYYLADQPGLVDFLLKEGASPDSPASDNQSLLALALQDNRPRLVASLLEKGAEADILLAGEPVIAQLINRADDWGLSAETLTQLCGNLLLTGADAEAPLTNGQRPLQLALAKDYRPIIDLLLPRCEDISDTLWLAIRAENDPAISQLLAKGASPLEQGPEGESPLIHAIRYGRVSLLNRLLSHGANPDEMAREGQRALFLALAMDRTQCALALINHDNRPALDAVMAEPVSEEFREHFGKKGFLDWYCRNETGLTPLMVAVMRGQLTVAERLIELGVDRFQGTSAPGVVYPIQMAAENKNVPMQQLLLGVSYRDEDQRRKFVIDLSEQKVRYYRDGELVRTSQVSTGRSGYRTPPGEYVITDKTRHKRSNIYNEAPMPYFQRFSCTAIGFHEGYTGSRFASHGCIRLPRATAQLFWKETKLGDRVTIQK
ncbi:MAG: ankyrin repeat domain-containing protein [Verrucomicrobiota bacterium JB023]|nr:ankyrin repeat domain-containing protein [Verrucomicrobiota bacterium JB023]